MHSLDNAHPALRDSMHAQGAYIDERTSNRGLLVLLEVVVHEAHDKGGLDP